MGALIALLPIEKMKGDARAKIDACYGVAILESNGITASREKHSERG
jgi:hypothetical protein